MNELALFAGAGGGLLATKWLLGWRTVCYVENAEYPIEVLKARIRDGLLDNAPIWDDARTFDGRPWRGCVDIITAGFPCQPFSQAGKQLADRDERNAWPATIRIIREVRPTYAFLENVPNLVTGSHRYFGTILGDLAESGYDAKWRMLSAAELGAPHIRRRVWIVARSRDVADTQGRRWSGNSGETMGNTEGIGWNDERLAQSKEYQRPQEQIGGHGSSNGKQTWWLSESSVGRVVDGVADRVDRIEAISNGQVPAVVAAVWELLQPFR